MSPVTYRTKGLANGMPLRQMAVANGRRVKNSVEQSPQNSA